MFFNKKAKVLPFPVNDGCAEINFESLSGKARDKFVKALPSLAVKKLTLTNCEVADDRCCSGDPYFPQIFNALVANKTIVELVLGEEFLTRHRRADLSKLNKMTALNTLTISVTDYADFTQLERYISDRHCKLEHLKIDTGMSVKQTAQIRDMLVNSHSLKTYEGPDQEEFQYLLDCKHAHQKLLHLI